MQIRFIKQKKEVIMIGTCMKSMHISYYLAVGDITNIYFIIYKQSKKLFYFSRLNIDIRTNN